MNIEDVLDERHQTHGRFENVASRSGMLRDIIFAAIRERDDQALPVFEVDQEEALLMISVKIARILVGDCNHPDHWRDIAGYATLVADRLEGKSR